MNERSLSRSLLAGRGALVVTGFLLVALIGCRNTEGTSLTPGAASNRSNTASAPPSPGKSTPPLIPRGPDAPVQPSAAARPITLPDITPTLTPVPQSSQPPVTPTPADLPTLDVVAPSDSSGLEIAFVRVIGTTSGTSVSINGLPASVAEDGGFQHDLSLKSGVNLIEVEASDAVGRTISQQITVFVVAPTAALPFSIFYPSDGLEVSEPKVFLMGVTRPDAVVGVNQVPVEINGSGIFSAEVELEEGPNLIEVVAADINGNVRFQTVVVFYIP